MSTTITADAETLMRQASMTASDYFHAAIRTIDQKFGDGYAQKHPELIGAFMQTAARDFQAAVTTQALQEIGRSLENRVA